jgi:hypothetical protein
MDTVRLRELAVSTLYMTGSLLQSIAGETDEAAVKTLQVKGDQQGRIKVSLQGWK